MGLLDMCCPKKPKKSLDYIIKWVEDADKKFKDIDTYLENLNTAINGDNGLDNRVTDLEDWKSTIDSTIDDLVHDAIEKYPWSTLPDEALSRKADKVMDAIEGNLASLDANGNLQDSGKKPADFALVGHSHSAIMDASTESNISIDEGVINIVIEEEGSGGETEINANNIGNLHRALIDPDDVPKQGSNNLITSGGVYNYKPSCIEDVVEGFQYAKVYVDNHNQGDPNVIIELNDSNTPKNPVTKSTTIGINNIDNLNRALATPSSIPEDDATKLITSKAVYDALAGKADVLKTLCINYDGQSQTETNYPISSSDKTLISAFIESVPENQYVPVIVMLMDENNADGTVIGLAKWNSSTSNNIPSIGVEVTIGKYKYNCSDYTVQDLECWYRTAIGQYHL